MNIADTRVNTKQDTQGFYLTADLSQRLDLICHLLANTELLPFVQAPEGCGKTRLARHLADTLTDQYTVSLISGAPMSGVGDLRAALAETSGLSPDSEISDVLLEEQFCKLAERKKNFLLLLDDADQMSAECLAWIIDFFRSQKVACNTRCVIFSAVDILALPISPLQLTELKDVVQVLDLPKFTLEQMRGFVELIRGSEQESMSDSQLQALQKQTHGVPGKVLWQVQFADLQQITDKAVSKKSEPWIKPLVAIAAMVFIVVVGGIFYFQDEINDFVADQETEDQASGSELQTLVIPEQQPVPLVVSEAATDMDNAAVDLATADLLPVSDPLDDINHQQATASGEEEIAPTSEEIVLQQDDNSSDETTQPQLSNQAADSAKPEDISPLAIKVEDQQAKAEDGQKTAEMQKIVEEHSAAPAPVTELAAASKPEVETDYKSMAWLQSTDNNSYTLQLIALSEEVSIRKFVEKHGFSGDLIIFETTRNGKPLFTLLYGAYETRDAALAAAKQLPSSYKSSSAWPRKVESLK